MERENDHPDFALMEVLTENNHLAAAVLAVGDRARRDGYAQGWKQRGNSNSFEVVIALVAGVLAGSLATAVVYTF